MLLLRARTEGKFLFWHWMILIIFFSGFYLLASYMGRQDVKDSISGLVDVGSTCVLAGFFIISAYFSYKKGRK